MFFRTRTNNAFERDYQDLQDVEVDLQHMNSIDLTDSEIEFLQMKRARNKHAVAAFTPDPRLGEYET